MHFDTKNYLKSNRYRLPHCQTPSYSEANARTGMGELISYPHNLCTLKSAVNYVFLKIYIFFYFRLIFYIFRLFWCINVKNKFFKK